MKRTLFAIAALALVTSTPAWGQVTLPHYEPINYTVGDSLQVQTNWTALNSGDPLMITSGNLTYTGLSTPTGNKFSFDGAGRDAAKQFTQQTSGTIYYSFPINITALGSLNTTGGYFTGFNEGTGTNFGGTVWTRQDGSGFDLGINPRTTAANTVWSSGTQTVNTTLFVVISYEIVTGSANDVVNLWLNPSPAYFGASTPPSATLTATNTTGTDLTNVNRIIIRQDATTATPFIEMDELRIGTTWASVTPAGEPTSQASGVGFNAVQSNQMNVTWTRGNGANCIVVAKAGSAVDGDPADGTSYTADAAFGNGTQIGTGNYVVYKGTGTSVTEIGRASCRERV